MCGIKKYLVVRASGGLANRLLALLGGMAFCLLTNRVLCVDWRDSLYSDDLSNVFPQWFEIHNLQYAEVEEVLTAFEQGLKLSPPFWEEYLPDAVAVEYLFAGNEHISAEGRAKSSYDITQDMEIHENSEPIVVHWGYNISSLKALCPLLGQKFPHLAGLSLEAVAQYLLTHHLRPRPEILEAVQAFYAEHFTQKPIGIHIRHSDLQSPLPQMLEKLQEVHSEGDAIFLCTDNELVEKMVKRIYPHCIVRKKDFQGANVPLHSNFDGISSKQKGFDALAEMFLLGECKDIIHYAPSSFASIPILRSGLYAGHAHSIPEQLIPRT